MVCYLLHFDEPIAHAKHYLGSTTNLERRISEHRRGYRARLMEVLKERGIGFQVARVWEGGDRQLEKKLKKQKQGTRLCPICNPRKEQ